MIKPATNHILVRPIGQPGYDIGSGMQIQEFVDVHLLDSCIGIVEAVCDDLYYGGYDVLACGRNPVGRNRDKVQRINEHSISYDVDIEVKPGDIVLFRYVVNLDEEAKLADGALLMRYDDLIARVDLVQTIDQAAADNYVLTGQLLWSNPTPVTSLYPLNGAVFVEMQDVTAESGGLRGIAAREQSWGTVVAEGQRVRSYLLWPERGGDFGESLLGKRVNFNAPVAVRIETDAFRMLNTGTRYPLYYLYRYAINGYVDGQI